MRARSLMDFSLPLYPSTRRAYGSSLILTYFSGQIQGSNSKLVWDRGLAGLNPSVDDEAVYALLWSISRFAFQCASIAYMSKTVSSGSILWEEEHSRFEIRDRRKPKDITESNISRITAIQIDCQKERVHHKDESAAEKQAIVGAKKFTSM